MHIYKSSDQVLTQKEESTETTIKKAADLGSQKPANDVVSPE